MISALYPIRIKARERLFCIDLPPVFELRVTIPGCDGESQKGLLDRFQGLNCSEFVFAICYAPPIVLLAFTTLSAATNPLEFVVAAPQSLIPPVVSKTSSFFAWEIPPRAGLDAFPSLFLKPDHSFGMNRQH
jgi:hypothetical protein